MGDSKNGINSKKEGGANNATGVVFISLRDPVERFYSAFNWRQRVFCDPSTSNNLNADCKSLPQTEKEILQQIKWNGFAAESQFSIEPQVLFHRYNRSADLLAKSLCNGTSQKQAWSDMKYIVHSKDRIVD